MTARIGSVLLVVGCCATACTQNEGTPGGDGTTETPGSGGLLGMAGNGDSTGTTDGVASASGGASATGGVIGGSGGVASASGGASATSGVIGGSGGAASASGGASATGGIIGGSGGAVSASGGASATSGVIGGSGGAMSGSGGDSGTEGSGGAVSGSGGDSATGGATGTCPSGGWAPGKQTINTEWDGVARQYVVYVPASYTGERPVPLMLVIHGAHNTPGLAESWSQMDTVADQNGFIIAYPAGLDCWNVGGLILPGCTAADDDVGFLENVVSEVETHACIDSKRVYATGISNGSIMAQYMGCNYADIFAAVGGVAGGVFGSCSPSRPLPVFYVLGTEDGTVGWDNGSNAQAWAERNNCNTTPTTAYNEGATTCTLYQGCDQGVEVEFCAITGMDHCWPDNCYLGAVDFKASPPMWEFFSQFSLP